jgi:SAM-dependent methyltransferase
MPSYLETIYFTEEYGPEFYPQKLCSHIYDAYYRDYVEKKKAKREKGPFRILDIGSGKGNHLVGFGRCGLKPYGLDKRDECVKVLEKFDIRECNIEKEKFPFRDNYFDFVFSKSVLEHVNNTDNMLQEAKRVLKPGGIAVMMTPDWRSEVRSFWDDYTHVKAFTRKSLQNAMKINTFGDVKCIRFFQLPFLWKYPWLKPVVWFFKLMPNFLIWKNFDESRDRKLIRFSKYEMLLAKGVKPLDRKQPAKKTSRKSNP